MRLSLLKQPKASFPLSLRWQIDLGYVSHERPAFQNNLVLFPANSIIKNYWFGLDAVDGKVVWSQQAKKSFLRCLTPKYLVISGPASLIVLNPNTGEIIWQRERGAETATCNQKVLFSSSAPRSSIAATDLSTGRPLWSGTNPAKSFSGVSYNSDADEIIASESTLPGDFYTVDPQNGKLNSSFARIANVLPYEDGRGAIYFVNQNELFIGGTVLDARSGEVIHKEDFYISKVPPTTTANSMYLPAFDKGIVAFNRDTYDIKWIYQPQHKVPWLPLFTLSQVEILDRIGYAIFSDATLRAIDLETGQELGYWQLEASDLLWWPICSFPPILCNKTARAGLAASDDTLFVSFGDGKLYAFSK